MIFLCSKGNARVSAKIWINEINKRFQHLALLHIGDLDSGAFTAYFANVFGRGNYPEHNHCIATPGNVWLALNTRYEQFGGFDTYTKPLTKEQRNSLEKWVLGYRQSTTQTALTYRINAN